MMLPLRLSLKPLNRSVPAMFGHVCSLQAFSEATHSCPMPHKVALDPQMQWDVFVSTTPVVDDVGVSSG
jgi:hypothetical protein